MPNLLQKQAHLTAVLQGILFSISCLVTPHALANPTPTSSLSSTEDLSISDRPVDDISLPETMDESANPSAFSSVSPTYNLEGPCSVPPPTAKALTAGAPGANAPNQSTRENEGAENQVVPTHSCAADLLGVFSPVGKGEQGTGVLTFTDLIAENPPPTEESIPVTEVPLAQENSQERPSETAPEVSPSSNTETQTADESDRWHFSFQPYATIPITTYGNATVKGRTVDYHLDLGELLDLLRFTASGRFEAWKGNLGFIIDAYYVSLQGSGTSEFRRFPDASLESVLKFDQGIYDFAISYNFGDSPMYSLPDKPSNKAFPLIWFQPIVGVRLNDLSSSIEEITLNTRRFRSLTSDRTFSAGRTWFEPMVGGKLGIQVSDPVTLWIRGDASGFGLAGDTDLSWNVFFGVDWWVSRTISLQLAYRFYEINYGNGSGNDAFGFEENFNGPVLSATFHF